MKSLLEIEQKIDLSLFERELGQNGKKRTKAGKYYWYILLLNIHISEKENRTIDKSAALKSFGRIFYRDYELKVTLLENFDGMQSSELAKMDFKAADRSYKKQINQLWGELIGDLELLYEKKKELFPKGKYPKQPKLNGLDFLDKKRPKLPLVSREYRRLLDSFDYLHLDNKISMSKDCLPKRGIVVDLLDQTASIYRIRMMRRIIYKLQTFVSSSQDIFRVKVCVETPTDAVNHLVSEYPDLVGELTNTELKYIIGLNFCLPTKKPLDKKFKQSLNKAIRRYKKDKQCQNLPLVKFKKT